MCYESAQKLSFEKKTSPFQRFSFNFFLFGMKMENGFYLLQLLQLMYSIDNSKCVRHFLAIVKLQIKDVNSTIFWFLLYSGNHKTGNLSSSSFFLVFMKCQ